MDKIDIVVTYVNSDDNNWNKDYNYWKNYEIEKKIAFSGNRQAFGIERIRLWDTFKYWFRAVENNCKWVNKIFLIVQNKNHVPKWLDQNNPKLRIVYHDEYIPKELLPTFNAMTIGLYISNIKDLSEQYILCDDDYYFINEITKDRFFKNNIPIHQDNKIHYGLYKCINGSDGVFYHILNNDLLLEREITNKKIKYGINHLPEARLKSFENKILTEYKDKILDHQITSKFRNKNNLCSYIFSDLLKLCDKALIENVYRNCSYCTLKSNVDFNSYKDKDMVCFNDTEQLDDYEETKKKFIDFLEKKFPNKSSYERR